MAQSLVDGRPARCIDDDPLWYVLRSYVVIEQVRVRAPGAGSALAAVQADVHGQLPRDVRETEPEYYGVTEKDQRGARVIVRDAHEF